MTQEVLKLALDALEACNRSDIKEVNEAITAIKKALAQRTEPPAWFPAVENILKEYGLQAMDFVADFKEAMKDAEQSQRTWVGMTDEEVKHEWEVWRANIPRYAGFAKGIEANLKQKNGYAEEKNT